MFDPNQHKEVLEHVRRGQAALDEKEWEDAQSALEMAIRAAKDRGLGHAGAHWMLAVAFDNGGRPEEALENVEACLTLDPTSSNALRSREIILGRLRDLVMDVDAPDERRMDAYRLLAARGEASFLNQVTYGHLMVRMGLGGEAQRLADALSVLWPGNTQVEALTKAVAGKADSRKEAR